MNKSLLWALLILVLVVLILIFNHSGRVDVNLIVTDITALKSIVFLAFVSIGVAIGVLIK